MRVPSVSLLRTYLRPSGLPCTQIRSATNWMPREKYAAVTRLDKLHRRQKAADRQERIDSIARANAMQSPSLTTNETLTAPSSPWEPAITSSPSTATPTAPSSTSPSSLPYRISRTSTESRSLPVYETTKAGGSLHITTIRKCNGDLPLLQAHLLSALNLEESYLDKKGRRKENAKINQLTKQIVVRGWRGAEVKKWCEMVGF